MKTLSVGRQILRPLPPGGPAPKGSPELPLAWTLPAALAVVAVVVALAVWGAPSGGVGASEATGVEDSAPSRPALPVTAPEARVLLAEAEGLFRLGANSEDPEAAQRLYEQALYRWLRVAELGAVRNGRLYYNIANTYYLLGDIGRAVLYYRRAELVAPGDRNLRHNLGYVRSQRVDRLPVRRTSPAVQVIFFWHYLPSLRGRFYLFAAGFAVSCLAAALALWRPRRWQLKALLGAGVFTLIMLVSLAVGEIRLRTFRDGVIVEREAVARKGDGTAYQRSFVDPLHAGTEFTLLEHREGWYHVRLSDGRSGWILASAAEMVLP